MVIRRKSEFLLLDCPVSRRFPLRQMYKVPVCVVSVLSIALISPLRAQDSSHNSQKVSSAPTGSLVAAQASSASVSRVPDSYGKLPISFEANQGQTDARVSFLAHGGSYSVYLTPSEVLLALHRSHGGEDLQTGLKRPLDPAAREKNVDRATVSMRLIGSNPEAQAEGTDLLPGKANYFIGSDPKKWHTDVPTYAKVRLNAVYPGVDLVYYGNQEGRLEHDFVVAPNADPSQIEFDLRDQDRAADFAGNELSLATQAGDVKLRAPVAYQIIGGKQRPVEAAYEDAGAGHIRFRLGAYDKEQPLVIDPVIVYTSVFGGSSNDVVEAIAIDSARNVYVAGLSDPSYPLVNPYQSTYGSDFVSKLNSTGTALVYSTYFGGNDTYYLHHLCGF